MRIVLVLAFVIVAGLPALANSKNELDDLASTVRFTGGGVELTLYNDMKVWHNGVQVETRESHLPTADPVPTVLLRPGDILTNATGWEFFNKQPFAARTFEAYRLDRVDGKTAWFTESIYAVKAVDLGRDKVRCVRGPLVAQHHLQVAEYAFIYESLLPGVEVHLQEGAARTK